ncbi:uncharacterized protein ACHE_10790S [Aspergillus chevalieri]|uniref:Uncharacterized protein n=1 Tax=Aspergillus chevalieri TaxID=182096 RepID=A0A7R7ZIL8_ASPCH|nr:uncharacterized protein ACHE_10790S [Aspergillus chevalieri]BCR83388.1 hypothetical protein ACHE_10790S [Aspergillus chevalieri]
MDLMDLPAELLCQFIDLAVSEGYGGLYERSTVNLRLVNHFFDIQVPARNFSYRCSRVLVNPRYEAMLAFTTRYLLQRPHSALDRRANFACLVNYVVV